MAQTSLTQLYGTRGRTMTPPAASLPFLSRAFERGPAGPFDISHPLMGFALGRGISKYQADMEIAAALEEAKKTELPAKWQAAVTADPTLASDPVKMTNWFMTNAPEMIKNLATVFQAQQAGAQAKETTALTIPRVAKTEAEAYRTAVTLPTLDIARAEEARARGGLLGQQMISETFRPSLLEAQTGTQKSLAELYGQRGITEKERRPVSIEQTQASTERLRALAGKLRKETELVGKESRYKTPSSMFNLLTNAMISHYWPVAEANLPEEKKLKGMAVMTDPMTGRPDEAKMRASLPPKTQREYDEVKLRAEELVSQGTNPTQAFRQAFEEVTGRAAALGGARPPVVFK